jgi:hypothetical protein
MLWLEPNAETMRDADHGIIAMPVFTWLIPGGVSPAAFAL